MQKFSLYKRKGEENKKKKSSAKSIIVTWFCFFTPLSIDFIFSRRSLMALFDFLTFPYNMH